MALLFNFDTWKWIENTNTWKVWRWTWKDYVPYMNFNDLWAWNLWTLLPLTPTTTYDLSWFKIGHEVSMALLVIENTWAWQTVNFWIKIYRKLTTWIEELKFYYSFSEYINQYYAYARWRWTWIDYDEEWNWIEYMRYEAIINWSVVKSITVTYTNIWNYQALVTTQDKAWSFWIEWANIAFIDNRYDWNRYAKHLIRNDWSIYSTWKTPWMIWVDQINHWKIWYIDEYWNERKTYLARNYWSFQQLPTWKTPWMICIETDIYSYLSFVWYDWKVYCIINWPVIWYENWLLP